MSLGRRPGARAAAVAAHQPARRRRRTRSAAAALRRRAINNVDFRRGSDGSGRVIVELTDPPRPADLRQEGGRIVVNFAGDRAARRADAALDVTDFATPVNTVDALRVGDGARLVITAAGDYEQLAYQSDNIYTIEIKPVVKLPPRAARIDEGIHAASA